MFELAMENFLGVLAMVLAVLVYVEMTAFRLYADNFFGWIYLRVVDDDTIRTLFDVVLVTCFVVTLVSYSILKFGDNESFKRRYVLAQEETLELIRSSKHTPDSSSRKRTHKLLRNSKSFHGFEKNKSKDAISRTLSLPEIGFSRAYPVAKPKDFRLKFSMGDTNYNVPSSLNSTYETFHDGENDIIEKEGKFVGNSMDIDKGKNNVKDLSNAPENPQLMYLEKTVALPTPPDVVPENIHNFRNTSQPRRRFRVVLMKKIRGFRKLLSCCGARNDCSENEMEAVNEKGVQVDIFKEAEKVCRH